MGTSPEAKGRGVRGEGAYEGGKRGWDMRLGVWVVGSGVPIPCRFRPFSLLPTSFLSLFPEGFTSVLLPVRFRLPSVRLLSGGFYGGVEG